MRERASCARKSATLLSPFRAFYGQWLMRWWKLETARRLWNSPNELLAAAEDVKDPAMLLFGNYARGCTSSSSASWSLRMSIWRRRWPFSTSGNLFPMELELRRVNSFVYLYFGLWTLGYPDRPGRNRARCWRWLSGLPIPSRFGLQASCLAAYINLIARGAARSAKARRRVDGAHRGARDSRAVSAMATTVRRRSAIAQGHYEEGIAADAPGHLRVSRATGRNAAALGSLPSGLEAREGIGRLEEGLSAVRRD